MAAEEKISGIADIYAAIFERLSGGASTLVAVPKLEEDGSNCCPAIFPKNSTCSYLSSGRQALEDLKQAITSWQGGLIIVMPPLDADFLRRELSSLIEVSLRSTKGLVALMLPESVLSNESQRDFRAKLFECCNPQLILFHERGAGPLGERVHSSFLLTTLVYRVGQSYEPPLRLFRMPSSNDDGGKENVLQDFSRLMKQEGGETKYGYVYRGEILPGQTIGFELLHPSLAENQEDLSQFGSLKPLSELVDAFIGIPVAQYASSICEEPSEGAIALVGGKEVLRDGSIEYGAKWLKNPSSRLTLSPGDLCLRAINGPSERLVVAEVQTNSPLAIPTSAVIVLRPKKKISETERLLLLPFLRSLQAAKYCSAHCPGVHIRMEALLKMPVPVADAAVAQAYDEIHRAALQFGALKEDAVEAISDLFEYVDATDKRLYLLSFGAKVRQKAEACLLADDPRHVIRTQFPYPLAYRWRSAESSWPDGEGYANLLGCAETTLCYLAVLCLSVARRLGHFGTSKINEIGERLSGGRGTTMGDWYSILKEFSSCKEFKESSDQIPFYPALALLKDDKVERLILDLKKRRDDNSHERGPKGGELPSFFKEAEETLYRFLSRCDFLADSALIYIENTRHDTLSGKTKYSYREFRGDHPFSPVLEATSDQINLEAKSLYARDRNGELVLLRPYLTGRYCPKCGSWSTFFLDQYHPQSDECVLKSMEHGHSLEDQELSEAFRCVGVRLQPKGAGYGK